MMRLFRATVLAGLTLLAGVSWGDDGDRGLKRVWWPDGTLRLEAGHDGEVFHGPYRTWYRDGRPYERRHYAHGHEHGSQQAWTPSGELYLNYEVWGGRRYGFVNAQPCVPVIEERTTT